MSDPIREQAERVARVFAECEWHDGKPLDVDLGADRHDCMYNDLRRCIATELHQARADATREALEKYGYHLGGCGVFETDGRPSDAILFPSRAAYLSAPGCSCGLGRALAAHDTGKP